MFIDMTKEQIKKIRLNLDLTHQQFANLLKVTRVCYTRYENGVRDIPSYIIQEINFFSRMSKREQTKELKRVCSR